MKNNNITRELKNKDNNVFRALNNIYGFNFENPFTLVKIPSPFTLNKVMKAIDGKHTEYDSKIVVVLESSNKWRSEKLYAVDVLGSGASDFNICHECRWHGFSTKIDYFFAKGDFNEERKTAANVYIFAQKRENLAKVYKPFKADFEDANARYIVKRTNKTVRGWRTENEYDFISSVDLVTVENHKKAEYPTRYRRGAEPRTLDSVIDKSGYIVNYKRLELQSRADELRKERAANKYKATDNSAIIESVKQRVESLKNTLVEMLAASTTYEQVKNCGSLINYFDGLSGIYFDVEILAKKDAEKAFSSIASFNNSVNSINEKINGVICKIEALSDSAKNEKGAA